VGTHASKKISRDQIRCTYLGIVEAQARYSELAEIRIILEVRLKRNKLLGTHESVKGVKR
jgi:hypothetical protein